MAELRRSTRTRLRCAEVAQRGLGPLYSLAPHTWAPECCGSCHDAFPTCGVCRSRRLFDYEGVRRCVRHLVGKGRSRLCSATHFTSSLPGSSTGSAHTGAFLHHARVRATPGEFLRKRFCPTTVSQTRFPLCFIVELCVSLWFGGVVRTVCAPVSGVVDSVARDDAKGPSVFVSSLVLFFSAAEALKQPQACGRAGAPSASTRVRMGARGRPHFRHM